MHATNMFDKTTEPQTAFQQQQQLANFLQQHPENLRLQQNSLPMPHHMPQPTADPWTLSTMPWELATSSSAGVMQFNAQNMARRLALHQKRKPEQVLPAPNPPKQFISEEKFTSYFNGLHISSDYIESAAADATIENNSCNEGNSAAKATGKCFTNLTYMDYQNTAKQLEEKLLKANRIVVCDEIKKIQDEHSKCIFMPEALMNHTEKPCNALVLWKPPVPLLEMLQPPTTDSLKQGLQTRQERDLLQPMNAGNNLQDFVVACDVDDDELLQNNNNNTAYSVDLNAIDEDEMDEDL